MIKKTIKYVNFEGKEVEQNLYFNLTEKEAMDIVGEKGQDWDEYVNKITAESGSNYKLTQEFADKIILTAYGIRDSGEFLKSPEISQKFSYSEAYSKFFIGLVTNPTEFEEFMTALTPKSTVVSDKPQLGLSK